MAEKRPSADSFFKEVPKRIKVDALNKRFEYEGQTDEECIIVGKINAYLAVMQEQLAALSGATLPHELYIGPAKHNARLARVVLHMEEFAIVSDLLEPEHATVPPVFKNGYAVKFTDGWQAYATLARHLTPAERSTFLTWFKDLVSMEGVRIAAIYAAANDCASMAEKYFGDQCTNSSTLLYERDVSLFEKDDAFFPICRFKITAASDTIIPFARCMASILESVLVKYPLKTCWRCVQ